MSLEEKNQALGRIADEVRVCTKCKLWKGRTNAVPGEGPSNARVMIVGEGPGKNEDLQGRPFVGAAGKNLDKFLSEAGLSRDDVFISNLVKCRTPKNRRPRRLEADTCVAHNLRRQIRTIAPEVIVLLGNTALKQFFSHESLAAVHGKRLMKEGQAYFVSYHPAAVLYNRKLMKTLLSDFQGLRNLLTPQN